MAEQGELILNNWTLGMSPEKYGGGSYLYAENINTTNNSKSFRLSYGLSTPEIINYRVNGYPIFNCRFTSNTWLTNDGYLETKNRTEYGLTRTTIGGPIYKAPSAYKNGIQVGSNLLGIRLDKVDRFVGGGSSLLDSELISDSYLGTTGSWTIGAGWTVGATGAVHTTGTTAISHPLSGLSGAYVRYIVRVTSWTTGTLAIKYNSTTLETISTTKKDRNLYYTFTGTGTDSITLTPSNTFDGTVEYVSIKTMSSEVNIDEFSITSASSHPVLLDGASLYIGSGSVIDVIDTSTWTIQPNIALFNTNDKIVGMVRSGSYIIVYTTDGVNSKQVYCNSSLTEIQETIVMENTIIEGVTTDGVNIYTVYNNGEIIKSLNIGSGYNISTIAKSKETNLVDSIDIAGRVSERFDFTAIYPNTLRYLNNKLYVPSSRGMYMYGKEYGSNNTLTKPYNFDKSFYTSITFYFGRIYFTRSVFNSEDTFQYNESTSISEYNNVTSGYLVTNPILRDNLGSQKDINNMKLGYILPHEQSNIEIRLGINNRYYRTFYVSGVTTSPVKGDIYTSATNTYTVIDSDITGGVGTVGCYCDNIKIWNIQPSMTLTKTSGTGDTSIESTDYENFVKIKTITSDRYKIGSELIFRDTFLESNIPNWNMMQFKIVCNSTDSTGTPEIFDLRLSSIIIDNND